MLEYPTSGPSDHPRRFQSKWFKTSNWLEYSPTTGAAYCFPCFLFKKKPFGNGGSDAFTVNSFKAWKRVGGKDCVFTTHMGKDTNSAHGFSVVMWENHKIPKGHIDTLFEKLTLKQIADNRLRLTTSIKVVRWLTFQKCAFRGRDEGVDSKNQGNFLEMLKLIASYNEEVQKVVLGNAPQNAIDTAPTTQKQILHIFAQKVQKEIREEIGDSKFCVIVDESHDISKMEQMATIIRFVDRNGILRERFLELVHVKDTTSKTLKEEICRVLSNHELDMKNIRGKDMMELVICVGNGMAYKLCL